jgi:xylulokinase
MSLAGLDVGTSSCRLIAFNESGKILASAYRSYSPDIASGHLEIDINELWCSIIEVIKEVALNLQNDPIKALGVSSMGDTLICTDSDFIPQRKAILAFDMRSKDACVQLVNKFGRTKIYKKTGIPAHPMNTASKILWIQQNEKDLLDKIDYYMCAEDFIIAKLTGNAIMSHSTAGRTMMFNSTEKSWCEDILEAIDIDSDYLSTTSRSASTVGIISAQVAKEIGLSNKVYVVTGGHDQICSAIGSGSIHHGKVTINSGTSECIIACIEDRKKNNIDNARLLDNHIAFYSYGYSKLWAAFGFFNTGHVINWCKDNLFKKEYSSAQKTQENIYETMFALLNDYQTKVQYIPHMLDNCDKQLNPQKIGVFSGTGFYTSEVDFFKAVLNSICFELHIIINTLEKARIDIEEIYLSGGGNRINNWIQQKADIIGREITVVDIFEASALGAAICAGTAIGVFDSLKQGSEAMVSSSRKFSPNLKIFEKYKEIAEQYSYLKEISNDISNTNK